MNFNNNDKKSLCLAYQRQDDIDVIRKFDINGISITSLKNDNFIERVLRLVIVYRKQVMSLDKFCGMQQYLLQANSVDVITDDLIMIFQKYH